MADLHLLANRPRLARLRNPEELVAVTTDGEDARADAIARLTRLGTALDAELAIATAIDARAARRPPIVNPVALTDLVRAGRRRLEHERVARRQAWTAARRTATDHLRGALEA